MAIQNTVLYGNGPNRTEIPSGNSIPKKGPLSWIEVINNLAPKVGVNIRDLSKKRLTLAFDEILLKTERQNAKSQLQNDLAVCIGRSRNPELDNVISCLSRNVLTTNYAYFHFEGQGYGNRSDKRIADVKENMHSLFRCMVGEKRKLWHIHGCTNVPTSLALGYRQYAKYQAQIEEYLTAGVKYSGNRLYKSPLSGDQPNFDFEKLGNPYSWVDLFLRDHIHVVGLDLDYTESTLWWLIVEKFYRQRRFPNYIGGLTYHHIEIVQKKLSATEIAKLNMLEDLGVKINKVVTKNYFDGYLAVSDCIRPGIKKMYESGNMKGMVKY